MSGVRGLDTAVGLGRGEHGCWVYDGAEGVRPLLAAYLAEGMRLRERLLYVGAGPREVLVDELTDLPGRDALLREGVLGVCCFAELEVPVPTVDGVRAEPPAGTLPVVGPRLPAEAFRRFATDAVAAGHVGLRLALDVTTLLAEGAITPRLVDAELAVATAFSVDHATALCLVDRSRAGSGARVTARLHRIQHLEGVEPTFALVPTPGVVHLVGEVDTTTADDLGRALAAYADATTGPLALDLLDLDFIDVAATRALALFERRMAAVGRSVSFAGVGPAAATTLRAFALNGEGQP
ncbi:MAG TPA: STAS domain-containing protein [Pedococcus sp.]